MHFKISTQSFIGKLILGFLFSALVGYWVGYTWVFITGFSLILLAVHYQHLFKLADWLWQSKAISPPEAEGVWGDIYNGLYRKIRRYRKKQKSQNERIRQFRDGAEALPDAALLLSQDLLIEWGNKKAQKFLGIRWPADIGQRIDNLIRFPDFIQYLENGKFDTPCLINSPINAELFLELRFMGYGKNQILFLARDVSNVQRLEQMRRDFVADVSHELKTPLTVVRGYIEMVQLTEHAFEPHWNKAFSTIESQVTRMDRLVEQLLILSRAEISSDRHEKQQVDVPSLLTALEEDAKWLNQDKNHDISFSVDPTIGLLGIESELKSAFANLVSNAIAYTEKNGKISVVWQKMGDKVKYHVQDNGPGIKPEHVNRITERFYRIDKSRSRDTGGSGLGLAIVKHVLNHHHGELVIESTEGQGSNFVIYFDAKSLIKLSS